ncbi:hypothetical protein [Treponema sp.]|uniref:hypothetical protein n=1 Tax=Treponema sp. TaxID=166 RepID=UPI00388E3768
MTELKNITAIVMAILEDNPQTRNSDEFLWIQVLKYYGVPTDEINLEKFMITRSLRGFPSLETVGRCRRKAQAEHPELKAIDSVKEGRAENEEIFRAWAVS